MINVLVLGAEGMVGREVFNYFSFLPEINVWGTIRDKKAITDKLVYLNAQSYQKDLKSIFQKTKRIDYFINCIGLLNDSYPLTDLVYVNALFPHLLEETATKYKSKLIHISTDAVFSPRCGKVTENSFPSPMDTYGMS